MRSYLLVAQRCVPSPGLRRLLEERCSEGPVEFHVLVPRAKRSVLVADPDVGRTDARDREILVDDQHYDVTQARLDSFMRALDDITMTHSGEILSGNVLRGIRRLLSRRSFDEVLVIGPNMGPRRRILRRRRDLATQVRRSCSVPVVVVEPADLAA